MSTSSDRGSSDRAPDQWRSGGPTAEGVQADGPLAGVRVLDLTAVLMGPVTTQLLGDMGADVIKVEPPRGDTSRGIGPMRNPGMGAGFLHVNRNKRGACIDLKQEEGRRALLAIAKTVDIVVTNVRPAAMKRLRLGHEDFAAANPRIIHAAVVGYGQRGPYAAYPAYDDLIQGAIGLPALVAQVGDGVPRYVPLVFVDRAVGTAAVNAILAALFARERSGRGAAIEVPMFETMVPFVMGEHMAGQSFIPATGDFGYPRLLAPERRPYATRDGHVCAVLYTDEHWRRFYCMTGREAAWETDPRVRTITERTRHMAGLCEENARFFATDTTQAWREKLMAADIPCMALNDPAQLPLDPHLEATGYFERFEHPSEGAHWQMRPSVDARPGWRTVVRGAPRLGEHTREVLLEVGLEPAEIDCLIASRAVICE